jgi:hypothetical protein
LSYGVRATAPVLAGIENPQDWEALLQSLLAAWVPVGGHDTECLLGLADGYRRLRRIRRYVTETTVNLLLDAARDEPPEIQCQIESLIGAPVIRRTVLGHIETDGTLRS